VRPRLPAARPRWLVPAIAAGAVVVALGAWLALGGGGAGAPATGGFDLRRIAVLYFEDLSRDGALRHVADGLTEDLIAQLERVRGLDVISRNGVAPFRGTGTPRDAVARALGAGTLVVGSVEAGEGGRVRVTTRLVDGTSGADVGRRASFTVPTAALLSAGDSVARDVAATLREWLGQEVALRERRSATASVAAWTLLQRAEKARKDAAAAARAGRADTAVALLAHADSLLAAAERDDRRWLDPVLERGWVARQRAGFESGAAATWLEQGLAHARRALEREPTRPDALALRGTLRYELYGVREATDPRGAATLLRDAQADLEAAVAADPALADANITLSYLYYDTKDVPGAQVAARRGYEEDPYLTRADAVLGRLFWSHLDLEQFPPAQRWCGEGARRFPADARFVSCELWLMATPAVPADPARAWALLARLDSLAAGPDGAWSRLQHRLVVGGVLARAGLADSARAVLAATRAAATAAVDPRQDLLPVEAYMRSLLRDYDVAIDLLKRYSAANPGHFDAATFGTAWWWRELRAQPRFRELTGTS
jgi:TolB-like protein